MTKLNDLVDQKSSFFYDKDSQTFFHQVSGVNPRTGLHDYHIVNTKNKIIHSYSYWKDIFPKAIELKEVKNCSQVDFPLSQSLYNKEVLLKERTTKKVFKAKVVDTCFSSGLKDKGLIVEFSKKDVKGLIRKYKMGKGMYSSRHKDYADCDLSNLFYGKHFEVLITK
jgi:hypothetical protein